MTEFQVGDLVMTKRGTSLLKKSKVHRVVKVMDGGCSLVVTATNLPYPSDWFVLLQRPS